jgi:hypothetical protein
VAADHQRPTHEPGRAALSLYPEDRGCAAPTTARILEIFSGVARHELTAPDGTVLRTFHPEFADLQQQVLDLLDIPPAPSRKYRLIAVREVRKASLVADYVEDVDNQARSTPSSWSPPSMMALAETPRCRSPKGSVRSSV